MKRLNMIAVALMALALAGCFKPYAKPLYFEANNNQTIYMVAPENGDKKSAKLDSAKACEEHRVMEKRITITQRWRPSDYEWIFYHGEYIPSMFVYVVERSPQARHWTAEKSTGTSQANQAIWLESKDGVKFSTPMNCTANVLEEDASNFLSWYPADNKLDANANQNIDPRLLECVYFTSIAEVLDSEVWEMCQVEACKFAFSHDMDELRSLKVQMNEAIRNKIVPFFKARGLNITTLGIAGDFLYANDKVQEAINAVFSAQQLERVESATLASMDNKIARMTAEGISAANQIYESAKGQADALRTEGSGKAAAIISEATGQAAAIKAQVAACKAAEGNPMFLPIKGLQIEEQRLRKWKHGVPQIMLSGTGQEPVPFYNVSDMIKPADTKPAAPIK